MKEEEEEEEEEGEIKERRREIGTEEEEEEEKEEEVGEEGGEKPPRDEVCVYRQSERAGRQAGPTGPPDCGSEGRLSVSQIKVWEPVESLCVVRPEKHLLTGR